MMTVRFLSVLLCVATLATGAHAQTTGNPEAPHKYASPLQQNVGAATAAPKGDRTDDITKRCKEIAAEYDNAFRPAGIDQANAVVPNDGRHGEQKNTMQRYIQRNDAEKQYRDLGCR
jgi:hypothetical protein